LTQRSLQVLFAALAAVTASVAAVAQTPSTCTALADAKRKTFGFRPSLLSKTEQESKTVEMDRFWDLAKAAGPDGLACVASLISDEQTDKYFLFDAASLLATFDRSGRSDSAIAGALGRTDLADLDPAGFIDLALQVAKRGGDIGPAAHNYMNAPNVTTRLPIHGGFTLDRTSGGLLLYGRMAPDLADKYLAIEAAATNQETRSSAAIVWSMNMTEASFKGLAALGEMTSFSDAARGHVRTVMRHVSIPVDRPAAFTREQVLARLAQWPDMSDGPSGPEGFANAFVATLTIADLATVREARRRLITGVSDETLSDYDQASRMLMVLINVLDAYKEHRLH
jgi:hypothetical protein